MYIRKSHFRLPFAVIWWSLFLGVVGCAPKVDEVVPEQPIARPSPSPKKIIVLRLENATNAGKADRDTAEDRLLGNRVKAEIAKALERTERFVATTNSGTKDVLSRGALSDSGEIKPQAKERLGSFGDAEFVVAGVLIAYQLSKESKAAGVEADLLYGKAQTETATSPALFETVKRSFNNLKTASSDRIAFELWMFETKTGKRIAVTQIEGKPGDEGEAMPTPMQRAVRGGAMKAAKWVLETEAAYHEGRLPTPAAETTAKTQHKKKTELTPPVKASSSSLEASSAGRKAKASQEKGTKSHSETTKSSSDAHVVPPKPVSDGEPAMSPKQQGAKASPRGEEWGE